MKFGFPIWYGDRPLRSAIEKIHKLGFDYIEFDLDCPWPERLTKEEINLLEKLKEEYNLEIAIHGPWDAIDISYLNDKISEASLNVISDAIKFSERLQPLYFNFHLRSSLNPHLFGFQDIKNELYKKALRNIKRIIDNAKVPLVLENNSTNIIFKTLEEFKMLKSYKINFCLDIGHAAKSKFFLEKLGTKTPELKDWFDVFKNKILTTHLHDCIIRDNEVIDHLPIGSGVIKFDEIFDAIRHTKCKYALIEVTSAVEGKRAEKKIKENLDFCKNNL